MQLQTTLPESKFPDEYSGVILIQINRIWKTYCKNTKGPDFMNHSIVYISIHTLFSVLWWKCQHLCGKLQRNVRQWGVYILKASHLWHISPQIHSEWLCTQDLPRWLVLWQICRSCKDSGRWTESERLWNSCMCVCVRGLSSAHFSQALWNDD